MTPDQEALLLSTVLPVLFRRHDRLEPIGTCFIIAHANDEAIALSARHLFDYATRDEWDAGAFGANLPPDLRPDPSQSVALGPTQLHSAYVSSDGRPHLLNIETLNTSSATDLAVCHLTFADRNAGAEFEHRLSIRSAPMTVGQPATMVGYSRHASYTSSPLPNGGARLTFPRTLQITSGRALKTADNHLSVGPSFLVDQSSIHGMSGGPVFSAGVAKEQFVVGLISNGASDVPETVCSELWPIYGFRIPWLSNAEGDPGTLLQMVEFGHIRDVSNPVAHFRTKPIGPRETESSWES